MAKDEVRIDKFMWATRIFKTRTIATEACKKGRVMLDGVAVKPSRMINGAYRRFCQSPKRIGTTDEKRRSSNEAIPRIGVCR